MRGDAERQTNMLLAVTPDSLVPADHPIRRIKPIVDAAQVVTEPAWGRSCRTPPPPRAPRPWR